MKISKQELFDVVENAMSWVVVVAMFVYGSFKFLQFGNVDEINESVSQLSGLQLMWAFYGYSMPFAIILGVFEVIGGVLILIKKTRIVGCLFTSVILINVILQDYFFEVPALKVAIFYQLILILILWMNREKLIEGIRATFLKHSKINLQPKFLLKVFISIALFVLIKVLEYTFL